VSEVVSSHQYSHNRRFWQVACVPYHKGAAMKCVNLTLLKFIGGPFDGFSQSVGDDLTDLPEAVALPLNRQAAKLFGLRCDATDRVAVYSLHHEAEASEYRFRGLRRKAG
jgi:hypothetical protein